MKLFAIAASVAALSGVALAAGMQTQSTSTASQSAMPASDMTVMSGSSAVKSVLPTRLARMAAARNWQPGNRCGL